MWYIILFFATLIVDQVSKILVDQTQANVVLIEGVLNIRISYNEGASFSMLAGKEWAQVFFVTLTVIVLIAGFVYLVIKKPRGKWLLSSIALLFSGTIGNFIDRLAFGKVRDFIDVPFFANFNIADSCLCVGAFMLIFYILFLDKDAIIKPLKKAEKTTTENDKSADNQPIDKDSDKNI